MNEEIKKEPVEYPNIVERFQEVLQKLGIKKYAGYVDHCAKGDLEDLEDVEQKLYEMGLHPSLRNQVLNFWAAEIKQPVPPKLQKRLAEERGIKPRDEVEKEAEAKYSVDTDTGDIRVAIKEEPNPLTWGEAEKLSTKIKKNIEAREKKEAKGEKGEKEPPFIQDSEGNWLLNPKAKVGGMELLAFEAVRKSQERGEPSDPFEILEKRAKEIETIRSVFGAGKEAGGLSELTDTLLKLKELTGADEETKNILGGIYNMLKEGGASKGESEDIKALREELKTLRDEREKEKWDRITTELAGLKGELAKARDESKAKNEYGIMDRALTIVDKRLSPIEHAITARFGTLPPPMSPEEKQKLTEGVRAVVEGAEELDELANSVFYGKG